jgi:hypothetical protein
LPCPLEYIDVSPTLFELVLLHLEKTQVELFVYYK